MRPLGSVAAVWLLASCGTTKVPLAHSETRLAGGHVSGGAPGGGVHADTAASSGEIATAGAEGDLVPVGFGAIRRRPTDAEVARAQADAVAAMQATEEMLPLNTASPFRFRTAASAKDPSFSWRKLGVVTPARDQGSCGSCWAFAAAAALEANWARVNNLQVIDIAEQHILSCAPGDCSGGELEAAVKFLVKKGTCRESEVPYVGAKNQCPIRQPSFKAVTYNFVAGKQMPTVAQIKDALIRHGPLAAFVYAEGMNHKKYFGGKVEITDDPEESSGKFFHFVLIVGWDDSKAGGKGAWEIKNSWKQGGKWWGDRGFGHVAYGVRSVGDLALWVQAPSSGGAVPPFLLPQQKFGIE